MRSLPSMMMGDCYYYCYYFDDDDRWLLISEKRKFQVVTFLTRLLLVQLTCLSRIVKGHSCL